MTKIVIVATQWHPCMHRTAVVMTVKALDQHKGLVNSTTKAPISILTTFLVNEGGQRLISKSLVAETIGNKFACTKRGGLRWFWSLGRDLVQKLKEQLAASTDDETSQS